MKFWLGVILFVMIVVIAGVALIYVVSHDITLTQWDTHCVRMYGDSTTEYLDCMAVYTQ